ncbi:hypothetical protein SCHPADRAFT_227213 [Schizopora paradoxa]|uniref:Zn(2)-C6 fungal-type domain-containing protein n=1 Tax=Schizopora paradoxa TaxID=27342 RepID=A0A0H2S387_9AGAM|nr:hypothetical protein SCHPADRAFT_227213 [Schizopora paradoxa]
MTSNPQSSLSSGCLNCRFENKRCIGGTPCLGCIQTNRSCINPGRQLPTVRPKAIFILLNSPPLDISQQSEQIINAYGPKASFGRYVDRPGHYVIYTVADGSTYVVNLDMEFRPVGRPRYLGHESDVARIQDNSNFTVDDLLNSAKNFNNPF